MATLTQYEASCETLPAWQRGTAAGPAVALRDRLKVDASFTSARDAIVSQKHHSERLASVNQLAAFMALTGP